MGSLMDDGANGLCVPEYEVSSKDFLDTFSAWVVTTPQHEQAEWSAASADDKRFVAWLRGRLEVVVFDRTDDRQSRLGEISWIVSQIAEMEMRCGCATEGHAGDDFSFGDGYAWSTNGRWRAWMDKLVELEVCEDSSPGGDDALWRIGEEYIRCLMASLDAQVPATSVDYFSLRRL